MNNIDTMTTNTIEIFHKQLEGSFWKIHGQNATTIPSSQVIPGHPRALGVPRSSSSIGNVFFHQLYLWLFVDTVMDLRVIHRMEQQ